MEVVDAAGRVVPTASDVVSLGVTGRGGEALAFLGGGNGDPSGLTPDKSATRPAFHGLLLGVFGSTDKARHLSIYLSIHLSIHPSIYPSIYLSIYLSTYLSTYLSIRQ